MSSEDNWTPEVGMEVFIVPNWGICSPYPEVITKVGRKYFYVGKWNERKYSIETKEEDNGEYSSQSYCYRSEADYKRSEELKEKRREIGRNIHRLPAEYIDHVYELIFPE